MKIVCYREGRVGFHVGDVVEIPDEADSFDGIHFKVVEEPDSKPAKPPLAKASNADQE